MPEEMREDTSIDTDIDCESIKIVNERQGQILHGMKTRNKNKIVWVEESISSRRRKPRKSNRKVMTEQIFDMIFMGAKPRQYQSKDLKRDPEKIERLRSDSDTQSIETICIRPSSSTFEWQRLRDVGLDASTSSSISFYGNESATYLFIIQIGLKYCPDETSNYWLSFSYKSSMVTICQQLVLISPGLFFVAHLPSIIMLFLFYLGPSDNLRYNLANGKS